MRTNSEHNCTADTNKSDARYSRVHRQVAPYIPLSHIGGDKTSGHSRWFGNPKKRQDILVPQLLPNYSFAPEALESFKLAALFINSIKTYLLVLVRSPVNNQLGELNSHISFFVSFIDE